MKTKIAFNDIPNGIERDEMRQILGGNVSSVYKEDSTVVSGRTDLLSGGAMGTWYSSVGDKGFMGSGSSYTTTDPNEIRQIMSALTGNAYSYNSTIYDNPQNPTDCVFQSIAYLASLYGNSSVNLNSIKDMYNSLASGAISNGTIGSAASGVDAYLLRSITDQYFNRDGQVKTISQLNSFINAGGENFAIGTYSVGNGSSHAIIITGTTATQFIGWDAQNKIAVSVNKNSITGFVAVRGACN